MSSFYHQKFHRSNHHTKPVSSDIFPDAANDPIASYEQPFQGNFVLSGCAFSSGIAAHSTSVAVVLSSEYQAIQAHGDAVFDDTISAPNIDITSDQTVILPVKTSTAQQCKIKLNNNDYVMRVWNNHTINYDSEAVDSTFYQTVVNIKYFEPFIYDIIEKEYTHGDSTLVADFIEMKVTGTRPIRFQWYRDGFALPQQHKSFIFTNEPGSYQLVATNLMGTISSEIVPVPFDTDILVTTKGNSLVTQNDDEILLTNVYLDVFHDDLLATQDNNYIFA